MPTLDRLFAPFQASAPRLPVRGITGDSHGVEPGTIFVAVQGRREDGHRFIGEAVRRGAVAVVGERELRLPVPYLRVDDARAALSRLAAELYGHPSHSLYVIGVTGTKGKTTTSALIHHLLRATGRHAGVISTVGVRHDDRSIIPRGHLTTPEAPELQATLAEMVRAGMDYAVIETSSHALSLQRVANVVYDLAIWTRLHAEHLDFHGTMEHYFRAKAGLVERAAFSVLNTDCAYAMRLSHRPHLTYGLERGDFTARSVREGPNGVSFTLHAPGYRGRVGLRSLGRFNIHNALAALAATYHIGLPFEETVPAIHSFGGVPGRMQIVQTDPVRVIVDYAHTPDSLAQALDAARRGLHGRLFLVIGAAGERDPRKRMPMGRLAIEGADLAILTEQDPRGEPLAVILEALERGARAAGGRRGRDYIVIPDREAAIRCALDWARPGDTVLLVGKGHERFFERGQRTMTWNEVDVVRSLL